MNKTTATTLLLSAAIASGTLFAQQGTTQPTTQPTTPAQPASRTAAQPRTFQLNADGSSRVQFVSDAPLETITGVSSNVSGSLAIDPANLTASKGTIKVRIDSLKTGIDLRDEHLRGEQWLNSPRFPEATFEVTSVRGPRTLAPNRSTPVTLIGKFSLRGVTKEVQVRARLRLVPLSDQTRSQYGVTTDLLIGQAQLKIKLPDYGVTVGPVVRLKISDDIEINVSIRAVDTAPTAAAPAAAAPGRPATPARPTTH